MSSKVYLTCSGSPVKLVAVKLIEAALAGLNEEVDTAIPAAAIKEDPSQIENTLAMM
ncbi:hypothetical protein [Nostoc sp. DedQUE09]|uniref:hypothetical protein n=1 Tax=Nostoc sp. DedQUE09 TaxID=3075394 RepID=UPI002AD439CE|nr:hypothetical protein [Nostoc sp. DedQUE09]MDZ7953466.1 hypothetical protein [Nostoc sp. DedQUE09]